MDDTTAMHDPRTHLENQMSLHRSLVSLAALALFTLPTTALAADASGVAGTVAAVEINHSTADTYLQYHGRIIVDSGNSKLTEYRWGGTSCSNKIVPVELVALLWEAFFRRDATTITPRYQSGQGTNKCLVGFSFTHTTVAPA